MPICKLPTFAPLLPLPTPTSPCTGRVGTPAQIARRNRFTTKRSICSLQACTKTSSKPISLVLPPRLRHGKFASEPKEPVRNAHIAILTDFSSNPFLAVRDRAADPVFAAMLFASACIGATMARILLLLSRSSVSAPTSNAYQFSSESSSVDDTGADWADFIDNGEEDAAYMPDGLPSTDSLSLASPSPAENAVWLNMSLRTIWRLFRKSTAYLTYSVIQPILDKVKLPTIIKSIEITKLSLGGRPALLRKIVRIPSRSLSEVQYRFNTHLIGDEDNIVDLNVKLSLPGLPASITVPIRISEFNIDARVWLAFTFVPYPPWIRFAQWAFDGMPDIKFSLGIGRFAHLSSIPLLSSIVTRILTVDIPRHFLFPNAKFIDFVRLGVERPEFDMRLMDARGIVPPAHIDDEADVRATHPHLADLFDVLDEDDDGKLDKNELVRGLVDWGFATQADQNSLFALLDANGDGFIQLDEFVSMWKDLENVFVPRRFRGVVSGILLEGEDLRKPFIGFSKPYVVLSVESQTSRSEGHRTVEAEKGKASVVWNEGWELYVEQAKKAQLRVEVKEGSPWAFYRNFVSAPPLLPSHSGVGDESRKTTEQNNKEGKENRDTLIGYGTMAISEMATYAENVCLDLTVGGGRISLEVQFNEFVDARYGNQYK